MTTTITDMFQTYSDGTGSAGPTLTREALMDDYRVWCSAHGVDAVDNRGLVSADEYAAAADGMAVAEYAEAVEVWMASAFGAAAPLTKREVAEYDQALCAAGGDADLLVAAGGESVVSAYSQRWAARDAAPVVDGDDAAREAYEAARA